MIGKRDFGDTYKSKRRKNREETERLEELREEADPEKGDFLALIIAGLTTILPVVLIILLLYYVISMVFFG